jgi:hypothetical protein
MIPFVDRYTLERIKIDQALRPKIKNLRYIHLEPNFLSPAAPNGKEWSADARNKRLDVKADLWLGRTLLVLAIFMIRIAEKNPERKPSSRAASAKS